VDNIIGIVTNSETKQGDKKGGGKWTLYIFQLKDTRGNVESYSCFDRSAREIEVGTAYDFAYEVNGDYKNLSTWMVVDADAHGLSMSTPAVNSQDEFRRSKEEMRWTEAYHMASRVLSPLIPAIDLEDLKSGISNWADFFYSKLEGCDDHEVTRSRDTPQNPSEAPAKVETTKTTAKKGRPPKIKPEEPEATTTAPDYALLKTFNDARVKAIMTMEYVNEYIEKTYKVTAVRQLSEEQLTELISYIGGLENE